MKESDIKVILEKAKPLIDYIEKELTMYHTVIVSKEGIRVVVDEAHLPKKALFN